LRHQSPVAEAAAFVKLRKLLASNRELARRFEQLEARTEKLVAHDQDRLTCITPWRRKIACAGN
jgi:hypothetical protein